MMRILLAAFLLACSPAMGQGYFQQKVDTKIEVRLDDKLHFLHGFEHFSYTNNSPDSLQYIYIHLWPNAYSSDRTRFSEQMVSLGNTSFYYSKAAERGYIDSLDFRIDGQQVSVYSADGLPDIARIDLPRILPPGSTIEVETPFRVKIPKVFSRLGHNGQAYYISQWFPKPAVYDRKGWHAMPYSEQGEFYSEIGSYDVHITLPRNYIVMGTGDYADQNELQWLDSLSKVALPAGDRPGSHVDDWRKKVNTMPSSSADYKTVHFREDNVHDFAWFADKRFVVRKDTVTVPGIPGSSTHLVTVYAAFLPSEKTTWMKATEYIRHTLLSYSDAIGPYPYNTVKAVEGDIKAGGGMEYPTVTVVDHAGGESLLMKMLVHEVGHNWFYGMLASNERDHAWLDEGFNTFYERKVVSQMKPTTAKKSLSNAEDILYYNAAATRTDQKLNATSTTYTKGNYGLDVYYKTALLLNWLESYMGPDTFRTAMQRYYTQWRFRHPYPEDVQAVFQQSTSKPLDWFFEGAVKTDRGIDFGIKSVRKAGNELSIRVRNNSNFPAPVHINSYEDDSLLESSWSLPFDNKLNLRLGNTKARSFRIASEIPDYYGLNNKYHSGALFHGKRLRIKPGIGMGKRDAAELYVLPAVGYNAYDGFMAGLLLHNLTVPQNRFRYALAGMWGTASNEFSGAGSIGYWIYSRGLFSEIVPQLDFKSFNYDQTDKNVASPLTARYMKLAPSISFSFRKVTPLSTVSRTLMLKAYSIWEDGFEFTLDPADSLYKPGMAATEQRTYGLLRYTHINSRTFNPFSYVLEGQLGKTYAKLSAEGNLRIDYNVRNKSLYLRGYIGKYISRGSGDASDYRYLLTTTYTALNDYLYDGCYFGRSEREGTWSQQVSVQEGGQKLPTPLYGFPLGKSDDWLIGVNLKSDLPFGSIPVRLYLDAGTYADAAKVNPSGSKFLYAAGLELHALNDIFLLHLPIVLCSDYKDYLKSIYPDNRFSHSITFSVQLQNVNWLRLVTNSMKQLSL